MIKNAAAQECSKGTVKVAYKIGIKVMRLFSLISFIFCQGILFSMKSHCYEIVCSLSTSSRLVKKGKFFLSKTFLGVGRAIKIIEGSVEWLN